jgi:hypothetical protein
MKFLNISKLNVKVGDYLCQYYDDDDDDDDDYYDSNELVVYVDDDYIRTRADVDGDYNKYKPTGIPYGYYSFAEFHSIICGYYDRMIKA